VILSVEEANQVGKLIEGSRFEKEA